MSLALSRIAAVILFASPFAALAQVSTHPTGDVFDTPPPAASAKGRPACAVAQKYVDNVNAGRYQDQGGLFAEDAVFVRPDGQVSHGSKEIGEFYSNFLGKITPKIIPISFIADGNECVMELAAMTRVNDSDKYMLGAIDHFTMNKQGKIQHMVVFIRPQSALTQSKIK